MSTSEWEVIPLKLIVLIRFPSVNICPSNFALTKHHSDTPHEKIVWRDVIPVILTILRLSWPTKNTRVPTDTVSFIQIVHLHHINVKLEKIKNWLFHLISDLIAHLIMPIITSYTCTSTLTNVFVMATDTDINVLISFVPHLSVVLLPNRSQINGMDTRKFLISPADITHSFIWVQLPDKEQQSIWTISNCQQCREIR